jgi:hypothetical protein
VDVIVEVDVISFSPVLRTVQMRAFTPKQRKHKHCSSLLLTSFNSMPNITSSLGLSSI